MEGLIALDLDGTVIHDSAPLDEKTAHYLESLAAKGLNLIFISGRTASWMIDKLKRISAPYAIAAQNGAVLIQMPDKKILDRKLISFDLIRLAEKISEEENLPFLQYGGFEENDRIFWQPERYSPVMLDYLTRRKDAFQEDFQEALLKQISAIKWIGKKEEIERISEKVEARLHLHAPPIRDPFNPNYYVCQATHLEANKGSALFSFKKALNLKGVSIVGGDDLNDTPLFEAGDIKIAMQAAPESLKKMADIVTPSIEFGLMEALQLAKPIVTVGVLIVSKDNRLFFARSERKWSGKWTIPGGKVEPGETLIQAAIREVKEETRLDIADVRFAKICESIFSKEFFKRRHFVMHDFVARLTSNEDAVILNDEAEEYGWFTIEEAKKLDLIEPGKELIQWWDHARHNWF
ncbi:MAG: HAD-IIB family hydrolase [Parachlamydiaceae bacterium]